MAEEIEKGPDVNDEGPQQTKRGDGKKKRKGKKKKNANKVDGSGEDMQKDVEHQSEEQRNDNKEEDKPDVDKDDDKQNGTKKKEATTDEIKSGNSEKEELAKEQKKKKTKDKKKKAKKKKDHNDDKEMEITTPRCAEERAKNALSEEIYKKLLLLGQTFTKVWTMIREHNLKLSKTSDILSKVENILTELDTTQNTYQFIWKIENFNDHFMAAKTGQKLAIFSPEIESHNYGYKIGVSLCPNGDGTGRNTHMSLFFCILRGEYDDILPWPFSCPLRFTLMDQGAAGGDEPADNIVGTFKPSSSPANEQFLYKPTTARNKALGLPRFALLRKVFEENKYLVDDTIFIKIEVDLNAFETRMD